MHKTAERNGVLFYLAVSYRKFAIIGYAGINAKVPAGEQLKTHFPYSKDDVNELSDEISFDKIKGE